jgi:hypothetical protein
MIKALDEKRMNGSRPVLNKGRMPQTEDEQSRQMPPIGELARQNSISDWCTDQ